MIIIASEIQFARHSQWCYLSGVLNMPKHLENDEAIVNNATSARSALTSQCVVCTVAGRGQEIASKAYVV